MQYPKPISELLHIGQNKLSELERRLRERDAVLEALRAALPETLACQVATAGIEAGRLSVGVSSAAWATRLRYAMAAARPRLAASLGVEITAVRIRVVRAAGGTVQA